MVTLLDGGMGFEIKLRGVKVLSHIGSIRSALLPATNLVGQMPQRPFLGEHSVDTLRI